MKHKFGIFTLLLFALFFIACTESKQTAEEYDRKITNSYESFSVYFMNYSISINKDEPEQKEVTRRNTLQILQTAIDSAKNIQAFENEESLINAYRNYLNTIEKLLRGNDSLRIALLSKKEMMNKNDSTEISNLTQNSLMICDKVYLEFQNAQKKFREKNRIK
ncbi:MAG: hypothetical protein ACK5D5_05785 [Bacteroidota bacterium]|jgi:hypothetical protein